MSGTEDMLEAAEVHALLGRAAEGAGEPRLGIEEAFAGAARIRRGRRRLALAGAAVAAVAAVLAVTLTPTAGPAGPATGSVTGESPKPDRTLPTPSRVKPDPGVTVQQLVPAGTGELKQLDDLRSIDPDGGVLDGTYVVHKDGRAGLIQVMGSLAIPDNPDCTGNEANASNCAYQDVGSGWGLRLEELPAQQHPQPFDGRTLGRSYDAILGFGTGKVLHVTVAAGFTGPGADGPAMAEPPLTMDQLRTFVLRPELLAGGDWTRQSPPPGMPTGH
ncbi:hypothetical protein CFP65_2962 [Kitasatospora sp. MMS16-BH015]|uniref:hypothetical protein n=1 Tax=Kitasatospora sp. MMS16-BH015 TaxID=2018025 RepID=UPI000CA2E350|nr:hypothetical protein [Kitasatospora sp. MMS16-BH015]AUG77772.1 hypothetical protein CFP65_2962 [Kitasatospora sp. MMS16-BH015]